MATESFIPGQSPLHRWQPRAKVVGLFALILGFSAVQRLWLLPVLVVISGGLFGLTGLPWLVLRRRLHIPGLLLFALVLLLPWLVGSTVLWQWGPLMLRWEGLRLVLLVTTRFLTILTLGTVLLTTTPITALVTGLRAWGCSPILTDMALLTYRYIYDLGNMLGTMHTAMQTRGLALGGPSSARLPLHQTHWTYLATLMTLVGTLFVRSYDQAERVYVAMRLRGYGQAAITPVLPPLTRADRWGLVGAISLGLALVILGWRPLA